MFLWATPFWSIFIICQNKCACDHICGPISDEYKSFTGRWNLAVYFQIRFQEIALPVEMALGDFTAERHGDSGGKFKLASTQAAADALKKCWDPGLYLPVLASKFLKLTFQILSRYSTGVSRTVTDLGLGKDGSETKSSEVCLHFDNQT